jgi:hypothetical protein
VQVSYIEIYNEQVNDLLDISKRNLQVRQNQKDIIIEGLSKHKTGSVEEVLALLELGNENKVIGDNSINQNSSRSHSIFRIDLKITEEMVKTGKKVTSYQQINLVDLAGSEQVGK